MTESTVDFDFLVYWLTHVGYDNDEAPILARALLESFVIHRRVHANRVTPP